MDTVIEQLKATIKEAGEHYWANELPDDFEVIEEGDWTQDYKYQQSTDVVQHVPSGRHFEVTQSRSGSYHTDWYYSEAELGDEVKKVTETVTVEKWVKA